MAKKNKHRKRFVVEVRTVMTLDLDDRLTPDDDWREHFYSNVRTIKDVAEHFAYNVVANGARCINQLDGFADRDESTCEIVAEHTEVDEVRSV